MLQDLDFLYDLETQNVYGSWDLVPPLESGIISMHKGHPSFLVLGSHCTNFRSGFVFFNSIFIFRHVAIVMNLFREVLVIEDI